jgi:hypothetical protein
MSVLDVMYLTEEFEPVEPSDPRMAMVKVRYPDGRIVFGFPARVVKNTFEGHEGRPGKIGGSLPRGEPKGSSPLNNKQLFHYTDEKSADTIHTGGFTVKQEGYSALLGRGVFLTDETGGDNFKKDFGKARVEAMVDVKNTLEIDGGYLGYFNWVLEEAERTGAPSPNPEDITNIVSTAGYDSVWIKGSKKGNIYIIFDAQNVKVTGVKKNKLFIQGGKGSGNFDHSGRPGQVGGSSSSSKGVSEVEVDRLINRPEILRKLRIPSVMYHVASKENSKEILKEGLTIGNSRASVSGSIRGVYLTDDPSDVSKQGGDIGGDTILKINTKGLSLRLDPEYYYYDDKSDKAILEWIDAINNGEESFALYSSRSIPPKNISLGK